MVEYMKQVAEQSSSDLSLEERNLLSVAYKNVVGARRASLRIIGSIESKEKEKGSANAQLVTNYKGKVEEELNKICQTSSPSSRRTSSARPWPRARPRRSSSTRR